MLQPKDIEEKKFRRCAFGGYSIEEVDDFLDEVLADYTKAYRDNAEYNKKITILVEKLEEYRRDEESLRNALVSAQRMSENILKDAKNKADLIIRDAQIRSEKIIKNSEEAIEEERNILARIRQEVSDFKERLMEMYKAHLELIASLPSVERKKAAAESEGNERSEDAEEDLQTEQGRNTVSAAEEAQAEPPHEGSADARAGARRTNFRVNIDYGQTLGEEAQEPQETDNVTAPIE